MSDQISEQKLFDGLIATYRDLNFKVRPLAEERLRLGTGRNSVRHAILEMRDDELRFSQALKDRLTGEDMVDVLHHDHKSQPPKFATPDNTTVEALSEFGTARESTLAMLRGLTPEAWDDTNHGSLTIREASNALLANDAVHLEKIINLLGSPNGN